MKTLLHNHLCKYYLSEHNRHIDFCLINKLICQNYNGKILSICDKKYNLWFLEIDLAKEKLVNIWKDEHYNPNANDIGLHDYDYLEWKWNEIENG